MKRTRLIELLAWLSLYWLLMWLFAIDPYPLQTIDTKPPLPNQAPCIRNVKLVVDGIPSNPLDFCIGPLTFQVHGGESADQIIRIE